MTKAEKIRAMTDEELADFLCDIRAHKSYGGCECCPADKFCKIGHTGFVDWLKKEVEG